MTQCIQERWAPHLRCFGCGPANDRGLGLRSFETGGDGTGLSATWRPSKCHEAYDGVLNGGIIGTLLDCHSIWTAAIHLMEVRGAETPPVCVTADYHIHLKRPTPTDRDISLSAEVVESSTRKAAVSARLECDGELCATCRGTFIAIPEGHPAYHGW